MKKIIGHATMENPLFDPPVFQKIGKSEIPKSSQRIDLWPDGTLTDNVGEVKVVDHCWYPPNQKLRRRIEDALRKTATEEQLLAIAGLLGVKIESL